MTNHTSRRARWAALLTLGLLTWSTGPLSAQSISLTGTVLDGESGDPLIGATILESGTTNATSAGADGSFTLKVNGLPAALKVSFIGYVAQTLTVETASPIRVSLDIDAKLVDEVVVVGYGRQKKKVSTGSISKVTAKDIEGIAVPDVTSTLEGLTSGLIVNESSGQPGSGKSILIRGISTNGDNSPLYIVDGVQLGNIDNINPSDIESVDVLKDAASSAIYGAQCRQRRGHHHHQEWQQGRRQHHLFRELPELPAMEASDHARGRGLCDLDAREIRQQQPDLRAGRVGLPQLR